MYQITIGSTLPGSNDHGSGELPQGFPTSILVRGSVWEGRNSFPAQDLLFGSLGERTHSTALRCGQVNAMAAGHKTLKAMSYHVLG